MATCAFFASAICLVTAFVVHARHADYPLRLTGVVAPPDNGRKMTRYGPAPSQAYLGIQCEPKGPPYYATRIAESCPWYIATEAEELPDGQLKAREVFVPGAWETEHVVDADQWCKVEGWRTKP